MDKTWCMALATNGNVVFPLLALAMTPFLLARKLFRKFYPDKD